ncbi:MAG: ABC transporter permease [Verrucomicrobiales bacterium]|jgi:spermidine/putrescine transport system permease protein|nr:ABC transporter permease [Verrucomicrobiales bacterium]
MTLNRPPKRSPEWWLTLPSLGWLALFFLIPAALIFLIAFRPALPNGGIGAGWSLAAVKSLLDPSYPMVIWRTIWVSASATALCLGLGVPVAYYIARLPAAKRRWVLLLIILPFWSNFLIRILAWQTLLHSEGPLKQTLELLHIMDPRTTLLYNVWVVLTVLVYTELPFAILPIYAAAEKFDFSLLDAARDLGASQFRAFWTVFLPGIKRGLLTALLVVLIPAFGTYAITDLVGGTQAEMIGNVIARRVLSDKNYPQASALSAALCLVILTPMLVALFTQRRKPKAQTSNSN